MEDIPQPLIINWDQTGTHFVPVSEWTVEVKGSKRVEVAGLNDKWQMTIVLAGTVNGVPSSTAYLFWFNIKKLTKECDISIRMACYRNSNSLVK